MLKMGAVQPYFVMAILFSLHSLDWEANVQGLTCVNDFINNVTCTLDSPSGEDCMIYGYKTIRIKEDGVTREIPIRRSCKVKQHRNTLPGCSFVFENKSFALFEKMPNISLKCNGEQVEYLKDYKPQSHIKMHPPGLPNVNLTDNDIMIDWNPGSHRSVFLKTFDYKVQTQNSDPMTKEAHTSHTNKPQLKIEAGQLKGKHRVRVKVKPANYEGSQWSEWSPTASLLGPESENQEWSLSQTFIILAVLIILVVLTIMMLMFYKGSISRRFPKMKPVPNPSKYLPLHGGNLKNWLNPYSAEPLHSAQPVDHISAVEVCESWNAGLSASTPPSSNCAPQPPNNIEPTAGSDENRLMDNSSSSSSYFSNLGYFVSGSSNSSVPTERNPVFTYKDNFHILHKAQNPNLHLSLHLCPALSKSPSCESFKRGAQSPDSGFCMGKEDIEVEEDKQGVNEEEEHVSGPRSSSHLSLPLHRPVQISSPLTPPDLSQISSDNAQTHAPMLATNVSAAGWPVACTMYRPSSMPVESSKTGYFVLQEIQTTFSNASI